MRTGERCRRKARRSASPSHLARSAILHAPSVTRILRELEARNLIYRTPDPADGRRSIIGISETGRELVEQTATQTLEYLDAYADSFGPERLAALLSEIRAFTETIHRKRYVPKDPA
ncbi:MarR family transcriptional regulator [Altericroceibacterium spongiae]|uniref:MarR family transcriptional regulator n=1 Tax=Altericroceibacterium spongiae TaxID=2320269 RepID=A0A420EAB6_9SPHN|nr:MarR family transcriptional regulator [Altericroceibacterium spongiae]